MNLNMKRLASVGLALLLMLGLSACNSKTVDKATPPASTSAQDSHGDHDHSQGDHDHAQGDHDLSHESHSSQAAGDSDMAKMREVLVGFSEADRASAMSQHVCPVSSEMLGSMGAPEKIDVNGQGVWICCEGCKDKLLAEPDKYLAIVAANKAGEEESE